LTSKNSDQPDIIPLEALLNAYANGVFPMAEDGEILWFSPERRGLIPLDSRFRIPHGLQRTLKRGLFEVRWNTAFREVMLACAEREETWIDEVILESYCALHDEGFAHSVECWDAEGLQGGLYGVVLPGVFFGESMFHRKTDASKVALVALVESLRENNFQLLDTQWMTDHLRQFGGYELPRREYLAQLQAALESAESSAE
jgi:leucyl/phenylalanyl-tRNA--protein transferase